jgi:hypothetical protein
MLIYRSLQQISTTIGRGKQEEKFSFLGEEEVESDV